MTKSFDVFLSHNSKDKPAVRELAEALRSRGLKVWLDEWELVPGRPWQEALEEIIETTRSSAVLVGKDGFGPWQDAEMRGCLSEFVERKLPVIPVLLPGAPEVPRLPFFLKRFTWVDLRRGLTEEGIDRLEWGITGKPPDRSKLLSTTFAEKQPKNEEEREEARREAELRGVREPVIGRWKKVGWGLGVLVAAALVGLAVLKILMPEPGVPLRNLEPEAEITTARTSFAVDEEVCFSGSNSRDPDGRIVSYEWFFNSKKMGSGEEWAHTFTAAKQVSIKLVVKDNDGGEGQVTRLFSVVPRPVPAILKQAQPRPVRPRLVPVHLLRAPNPWRYRLTTDQEEAKAKGWKIEEDVFIRAYSEPVDGTVPIYEHSARETQFPFLGTIKYRYTLERNDEVNGWGVGRPKFYAFKSERKGTVPVYESHAGNPWRVRYSRSPSNISGWIGSVPRFYAFPP